MSLNPHEPGSRGSHGDSHQADPALGPLRHPLSHRQPPGWLHRLAMAASSWLRPSSSGEESTSREPSPAHVQAAEWLRQLTPDFEGIVSSTPERAKPEVADELEPVRSLVPLRASLPSPPSSSQPYYQVYSLQPAHDTRAVARPQEEVYGTSLRFDHAVPEDYDDDDLIEVDAHNQTMVLEHLVNDSYAEVIRKFYRNVVPPVPPSVLDYSFSEIAEPVLPPVSPRVEALLEEVDRRRRAALAEKSTAFTPLEPSQLAKVKAIWALRSLSPVCDAYNILITPHDLRTLAEGQWLNDNVIDFYMNEVMAAYPLVHVWTTHFYTTLEGKGYQGVARWAKRKKLNAFEKAKVLVPINIRNTHWALAEIDNSSKVITYYDLLTLGGNARVPETLKEYMGHEAKRLGVECPEYEISANGGSPQQQNGFDCGVFACTNARLLAAQAKLAYSQRDMKTIRQRMAYEIVTTKLL